MITVAIDVRMAQSSGIGTVLTNITRRLVSGNPAWRFVLLGHEVALRSMAWTAAPNVKLAAFTAPFYSIREQIDFPVHALRGCDLLWSPNYNIPVRWRGKLAVTVHDVAHLVLPEIRQSLAKRLYARAIFAHTRRRADATLFVSQFSREEFHRHVGKPRGRELVCPAGVDESWFDPAPATAPARPYILFVGNVKLHKNLARLLDAYGRIRYAIPHDLMVVGRKDGFITGDTGITRRIGEFGGRVSFTGQVSDVELRALYGQADALVLPSLYEGFGLPPLEAMAAGCPVLVSRAASLPEVCEDAALYCDPLDIEDIAFQMRRLVDDKDLRQALRKKGHARAREMNWSKTAQDYRDTFLDLAG